MATRLEASTRVRWSAPNQSSHVIRIAKGSGDTTTEGTILACLEIMKDSSWKQYHILSLQPACRSTAAVRQEEYAAVVVINSSRVNGTPTYGGGAPIGVAPPKAALFSTGRINPRTLSGYKWR